MVYKRYIYRDGKKFGPYYYYTYRDKHGKTHSRYVSDGKQIGAVTEHKTSPHIFAQHKTLFILLGIIALFLITLMILNNSVKQEGTSSSSSGFSFKTLGDNIKSFVTGFTSEEGDQTSSDAGSETPPEETTTPAENIPTEPAPEQPIETPTEPLTESTTPQEDINQTVPVEEVVNETIPEPETNGTQETNVTEQTNETAPGEESEGGVSGAGIIGNVTNETIINGTINNETIFNITNETLGNFTLENGTLVNETNVTIINETANITLDTSTKQFGAVLGQPVKWEKKVKVELEGTEFTNDLTIDIPNIAENISVKRVLEDREEQIEDFVKSEKTVEEGKDEKEKTQDTEGGSFLTRTFNFILGFFGRGITGRSVENAENSESVLEINEEINNNEEVIVEYFTDAPYSIEEEISEGKRVKIVGPDEIHYENVLVFTDLNESLGIKDPSRISIYWEENATYVPVQNVSDINNNGIYDYIEWIVPHLSNQTFNIIVITKAEHLDNNRTFVSDIYEQVRALDGIWSEEIPNTHYVRITFERNLTSERDISIYPRVISGTPRIEIYEKDGSDLVAEFESLVDNEYNKVYLSGLQGHQDTFDLKVLGGSVEFDHIIDPAPVTLQINSGNITADVDYVRLSKDSFQMTWNISLIPAGSTINNATLCIREVSADVNPSMDADANQSRIDNRTWTESITAAGYNNRTLLPFTNTTQAYSWSSIASSTWWCLNVTDIVVTDYGIGNSLTSMRLEDPDNQPTTGGTVTNSTVLFFGATGLSEGPSFASREYTVDTSLRPYLNVTYTPAAGDTAPQWSTNSTNSTGHGLAVKHSVYWTDDTALAGYIFSFDNGTGTFVNDSFVNMIGTTNWSNVTKVVNNTIGSTIRWRVYANDSSNQWNVTSIFSYLTTDNPPTVILLSPENNSIISNPYINQTFSSNVTDDLNITKVQWWADFRGSGWRLEQTNSTLGLINAVYNFTFNFSNWFGSLHTITSTNLSNVNGRALNGNATHFFMTSYQDDLIKWFLKDGTYIINYSLPTTWIADLDNNGTDMYMIDLAQANPIRHTYFNGTVIDSCAIAGAGGATLTGIAFDNDNTTLWVTFSGSPDQLRHYTTSCTSIENITLPTSTPTTLDIDSNNLAYVIDEIISPHDQIMVINLEDGSNPYNITNIAVLVDSPDQPKGVYIEQNDSYPEKIYTTESTPNELTYIQRRLSGNVTWNVNASDNNSQSSFGDANWTFTIVTPAPRWSSNSTSSTEAGLAVLHNIYWTDDVALAGYIFSFDNGTGTLTNDSWVAFTGTTNWSNVTKVINITAGSTIQWRVYANDSLNQWNVTDIFSYNNTCGNLTKSLTLSQNQTSVGACFTIGANSVVLDCNGYTVTYGTGGAGNVYGLENINYNNSIIKNCIIQKSNADTVNSFGIYLHDNVNNNTITNNNVTTNGPNNVGIYLASTSYNNSVYSNTINTTSSSSYGIQLHATSYNNSIYSNTINTAGSSSYGIRLSSTSYNNSVYSNTINTTGTSGYGVFLQTDVYNNNFTDNTITTSASSIYLDGATTPIYNNLFANSTITNNSATNVESVTNAYQNTLLNMTFNKSKVVFTSCSSCNLTVQWYYRTNVTDQRAVVVQSATVTVKNVSGTQIDSQSTDANGFTNYVRINEYTQNGTAAYSTGCTGSGANITCATPHNVTASKTGYGTNSTNVTIDSSLTRLIILSTPYILAYVPLSDNVSIAEPSNQTFSITYTNTSNIYIKWYINNTEQTSYQNNSQYIWVGNYTQAGTYIIRVNISNSIGSDQRNWTLTVNDTNTAPTHTNPLLSPYPPLDSQNLTCTNQSTSDAENDSVTNVYNWLMNSTSILALNLPFETNSSNTSSGAIKDYSGNNNNATLSVSTETPTWKLGKVGGSYDFDGVDDYMSIPSSYSLNSTHDNMTILFWVNPKTPVSGNNYFVYKGTGVSTSDEYFIRLSGSKILVKLFNETGSSNVSITSANMIANNTFTFIAFTYNGTNLSIYINGTLENSTSTAIDLRKSNNNIEFAFEPLLGAYSNMTLDEIRIYNRTLSSNQINQIYQDSVNGYSNSSTITSTETISGENWTCEVTPNDAKLNGNMSSNSTIISSDFSVAIDLSPSLAQQVNWSLTSLPANNQSAEGNNGTGITEYWVNVSVTGSAADLYMRADGNLTTVGGDILVLGNETYSYNTTNNTVPSDVKTALTTSYSNHLIGDNLPVGNTLVYLKFFLSAPSAQLAGTYNNTLQFKAVQDGQTP